MLIHPFVAWAWRAVIALLVFGAFWYSKPEPLIWVSAHRSELANFLFPYITRCGEIVAYVVVGLAVAVRQPMRGAWVALAGVVSMLSSWGLKSLFGEARPAMFFRELHPELLDVVNFVPGVELSESWTNSFPSGHTMAAFALYGLLAGWTRSGWGGAWLLLALAVGASRIYLMQHFLTDVAAGALVGTGIALAVLWLQRFVEEWRAGRWAGKT